MSMFTEMFNVFTANNSFNYAVLMNAYDQAIRDFHNKFKDVKSNTCVKTIEFKGNYKTFIDDMLSYINIDTVINYSQLKIPLDNNNIMLLKRTIAFICYIHDVIYYYMNEMNENIDLTLCDQIGPFKLNSDIFTKVCTISKEPNRYNEKLKNGLFTPTNMTNAQISEEYLLFIYRLITLKFKQGRELSNDEKVIMYWVKYFYDILDEELNHTEEGVKVSKTFVHACVKLSLSLRIVVGMVVLKRFYSVKEFEDTVESFSFNNDNPNDILRLKLSVLIPLPFASKDACYRIFTNLDNVVLSPLYTLYKGIDDEKYNEALHFYSGLPGRIMFGKLKIKDFDDTCLAYSFIKFKIAEANAEFAFSYLRTILCEGINADRDLADLWYNMYLMDVKWKHWNTFVTTNKEEWKLLKVFRLNMEHQLKVTSSDIHINGLRKHHFSKDWCEYKIYVTTSVLKGKYSPIKVLRLQPLKDGMKPNPYEIYFKDKYLTNFPNELVLQFRRDPNAFISIIKDYIKENIERVKNAKMKNEKARENLINIYSKLLNNIDNVKTY